MYDILNCGPRNRFVVASNGGGVIAHNCLSGDYGAGWQKQQQQLRLRGVVLTDAEAQQLNHAHKDLHRGVYKEFIPNLESEWKRHGGWVYSGLGHPVCVFEGAKKDLCNRVVQSTGHKIHVIYTSELARRLQQSLVQFHGIIWDLHDQAVVQVPTEMGAEAKRITEETVVWLNEYLGSVVKLKTEPQLVTNLAAAKMDEAYAKKYGGAK